MNNYSILIGRIFLAHIFLLSGINKITSYEASAQYMASGGVPGALLPAVIALEILAAVAIIIGFRTKWACWALAAFSIVAAVLYHMDFGNQMQMIMFMKNFAIAGGFLVLAEHGPGPLSIDKR
ncbi:MAG: DoxX family protein [Gammaproteobacteria bacterium]|nr:DoxX family protein [Gammaproteobacteria bacterium]